MKIGKKTLATVAVLTIALLAVSGFAAFLLTRSVNISFNVSHGNLVIYQDSDLTTPMTSWNVGAVAFYGDTPFVATVTIYVKNTGPNAVNCVWSAPGIGNSMLLVTTNSGESLIPENTVLGWDPEQLRPLALTLTIPATVADGAGGFTFNLDVSTA